MGVRLKRTLIAFAAALAALGPVAVAAAALDGPDSETIEIYVQQGCPHCAKAKAFLSGLAQRRPGLVVTTWDLSAEPEARARLGALSREHGARVAVPTMVANGRVIVGFADAATTGREIEAALDGRSSDRVGRRSVDLPVFGTVDAGAIGLPLFTLAVGAVDGFNPCATWVLLFVLSLLIHLKSRARMLLVGGVFVLVSGLVYFAFMAAWLNFFLLVGVSRVVQLVLGVVAIGVGGMHVKDFFAFGRGPSLSIPESAKPGIYRQTRRILQAENLTGALAAVTVLAFLVNTVELLCTAGLPAIYTQVLTAQEVSGLARYGYLALYNIVYMLDDAALLAVAVVTLSQRRLQERGGRALKGVSGAVMLALGLVLVARPTLLSWGAP